jgi:NAD(P)-dependent dehydrogenase (short-subunit alcohol dehydrogenase family)
MGLVGLMNTLKLEGAKYNITVNTVAPLAVTRLTEDVLPPDLPPSSSPSSSPPSSSTSAPNNAPTRAWC